MKFAIFNSMREGSQMYAGKGVRVCAMILVAAGIMTTPACAQTLPQTAFSQVQGVILDSVSSQPVPLVSMSLLNKKKTLLVRGTGNQSGVVALGQVPPDTYTLTISGNGYRAQTIGPIRVKTAGLSIQLDTIRLQSSHTVPARTHYAPGRIKGVVVDSATGRPLPLMSMNLVNKRRTSIRRESGSDQGFFLFDQVPPDTYTLIISGLGYETKIIRGVQVNATDRIIQFDAIRLKELTSPAKQPVSIPSRPVQYAKPRPASVQRLISRQP
jgi:hypothetical protein